MGYSSPLIPYFRFSCSTFPSTKEVSVQCRIPLGITISPRDVENVPILDYRTLSDAIRCKFCSAYLCPQAICAPDSRTWECPFCHKNSDVPIQFGSTPISHRPETQNFVYDILCCPSPNQRNAVPFFLFAIDLSHHAFSIGFSQQMIESIKRSLDFVPPHTHVGLLGYSDRILFFDLQNRRISIVADLSDFVFTFRLFAACPTLETCKPSFLAALDSLLSGAAPDATAGHCAGSLYSFAERILFRTGGCLFMGAVGLPREGPHVLAERTAEDSLMLRLPSDGSGKWYRDAAMSLNRAAVSTHLFVAGPKYMNLACLAVPAGLSSGSCLFYPEFDEAARQQLHVDLFERMTREYNWDATGRLQLSPELKVVRPLTNCVISTDGTASLCAVGRKVGIAYEIAVENPVARESAVFQYAFRFVNADGQRVLRVFTFAARVSGDPRAVLASVDEGALATVLERKAVTAILNAGPIAGLEAFRKEVVAILTCGARFLALQQLLYGMLANDVFHQKLGYDWLMTEMIRWRSLTAVEALLTVYPRLVCVDAGRVVVPLTGASFAAGRCFLVHLYNQIVVWVSSEVDREWLREGFGVGSLGEMPADVPSLSGKANSDLNEEIQLCRVISGKYLPVVVIAQGDPREGIFGQILVEDLAFTGVVFSEWKKQLERGLM